MTADAVSTAQQNQGFRVADLREAGPADVDQIADILAQAFEHDPVMNWTFGPSVNFTSVFRELARGIYLKRGFGHVVDNAAATLWLPAGESTTPPLGTELRLLFQLFGGGLATLRRAFGVGKVMEQHHPETEHYYLFAVGVLPSARGQGLGGRLIREGLKKADADNIPAYLENSNPTNTPLYERLGFEAVAPLPLGGDAPPLLGMQRPVPEPATLAGVGPS